VFPSSWHKICGVKLVLLKTETAAALIKRKIISVTTVKNPAGRSFLRFNKLLKTVIKMLSSYFKFWYCIDNVKKSNIYL